MEGYSDHAGSINFVSRRHHSRFQGLGSRADNEGTPHRVGGSKFWLQGLRIVNLKAFRVQGLPRELLQGSHKIYSEEGKGLLRYPCLGAPW